MSKEAFLHAVTALANEHGVVAFVVSAVVPSPEGFSISAGAASRLDDSVEESDEVIKSMMRSAEGAVEKLKAGKIETTYLN